MAKIRDDLVGVVYLNDGRKLAAGDTVPDDVEVGDHLAETASPSRARTAKGAKGNGDDAAGNPS